MNISTLTRSNWLKTGANSFSRNSASSEPTLKLIIVPTFPNTASFIVVSLLAVSWPMYWWTTVKPRPYFRASERIVAIEFVVKFWNSSICR